MNNSELSIEQRETAAAELHGILLVISSPRKGQKRFHSTKICTGTLKMANVLVQQL